MSSATASPASIARVVHRIEVRSVGDDDPRAASVRREAEAMGLSPAGATVARVYLIEGELDEAAVGRLVSGLLASPVAEWATLGAAPVAPGAQVIEVHPLPGVMDPPAQTVARAGEELLGVSGLRVSTGWRYDLTGVTAEQARRLASSRLANEVVHGVHVEPYHPRELPHGAPAAFRLTSVPIRDLDEAQLARLSREGHLFLDPAEMRAVQDHYRALDRDPTDIELETIAQTWSEHCVHKTLKSTIRYEGPADDVIEWSGRPGHTVDGGVVVIDNLLKRTVAAATHELIEEGVDWTLSVFVDNAGIIAFDDERAVCVKVETHNHPSAIEPYGGAATGAGGCIRDILGAGLAARPIAATDVFCVAPAGTPAPDGALDPTRVLTQVVAGVRDYGNRVGVPTLSGAVSFDERYVGNPLVFCGCVGIMPRDKVRGEAEPGDLIVALGGRTGRDGVHGATFSSAELTDSHADEFSHAVQIGNPIEEKKVIDAVLRARDHESGPLFSAITDCGAGGFSSAVGEMGEAIGATVELDRAPLKYDGLTYTEIWISEAQERMVLAVPESRLGALRAICREESVELAVLGVFGTDRRDLVLNYRGEEVGRLDMRFLHEGLPAPHRAARWTPPATPARSAPELDAGETLLRVLADPNVASKRWIVEQYDHEVQGATVIKPLVGPGGAGPGDATVIAPAAGSRRGLAISQGLATGLGDASRGGDPYLMALAAVDECVRNLVCVGADPDRIAILDNFCWPSCAKPENLGALVRAAAGCYDAAKAYRTPFVSGKDSLNNQFTTKDGRTIEIPPTLLITGIGLVADVERCVTSDAKRAGNSIVLVGPACDTLGGSVAARLIGGSGPPPRTDLRLAPRAARAVAGLIERGLVRSAHDVSEGGLLAAVAEMLIGAGEEIGARLRLEDADAAELFGEAPARYVLEVETDRLDELSRTLGGVPHRVLGELDDSGRLHGSGVDLGVDALARAHATPHDGSRR